MDRDHDCQRSSGQAAREHAAPAPPAAAPAASRRELFGRQRSAAQAKPRRSAGGLLLAGALVATWGALLAGTLELAELRVGDALFRWRHAIFGPPAPASEVVVVAIDEPSMQEVGLPWPWPRGLHAELVQALTAAGATTVVFDILFVEATQPLDDGLLAAALEDSGRVILAMDYTVIEDTAVRQEIPVLPQEPLLAVAADVGLAAVVMDPDGAVRRAFPRQGETPALFLAAARHHAAALGRSTDFDLPGGLDRPLRVDYLGPPRSVPTVSYWQALEPQSFLPPGLFAGKVALVGRSLSAAIDLDSVDHFAYPFRAASRSAIAGVEIHATLVDQLLRSRFLHETPVAVSGAATTGLLLLAAVALRHLRPAAAGAAVTLLAAGWTLAAFLLFALADRIVPVTTPLAGLTLFFASERIHQFVVVDRQRRFIQRAFKHYVSPAVVDRLVADPEQLNLWGEHAETTVVFTDLVGFTSLAERLEPMQLRRFLTGYFGEMVDVMLRHDGTLDKFIGDAMMCFFGVPVATAEHPRQGVLCAWEMHRRLLELNDQWAREGLPPLAMRIGVNSGRVVAGNIGTAEVFNFTIMGDAVNLGARLESANKRYGTAILVGEATRRQIGEEIAFRQLDVVRVKGKEEAVAIYELLGPRAEADPARLAAADLYETAFARYREGRFTVALDLLADPMLAADRPSALLAERCRVALAGISESVPDGLPGGVPEGWDGVNTLSEK